ncbi:hypothetical protein DPMN_030842 [Dreissena polymorpha]|uniref:Uncharacterized protein n=1 Tax=Dreissena polymorpha TaxID=45954 RepID=A0A9D4M139_DREPO|nr:hypothetical protein DPMN_030842 [Dreissena polymorpha]
MLATYVIFLTEDVVEKENTWYMWVVGACVGTFVMLLIGTVVTLYYMWRHRVVLVMKIVHYFQAYEEDGKVFHVVGTCFLNKQQ